MNKNNNAIVRDCLGQYIYVGDSLSPDKDRNLPTRACVVEIISDNNIRIKFSSGTRHLRGSPETIHLVCFNKSSWVKSSTIGCILGA